MTKYEFTIKGRELPLIENHPTQVAAERRADQLAEQTGREVRVYRSSDGMMASPIYRSH